MTRWFGKKVDGQVLRNLISALGENPGKLLQKPAEPGNTIVSTHGRVGFTPTNECLDVDLYIFREEVNNSGTKYFNHNIQGEIKYSVGKNKIKQGTSTGEGVSI
jgi:hypothetical protein